LDKDDIARDILPLGQFETIAQQFSDVENYPGFGHLGQYRHELILIDLPERQAPPDRRQLTSDEVRYESAISC